MDQFPVGQKRSLIDYLEPDIHYSTLMFFVFLSTTAWITWRWRKTVAALSKCQA